MRIPTEISFYDEHLGKRIRGFYVVKSKTIVVSSADGTKSARLGAFQDRQGQEFLARSLLSELARETADKLK